MKYNESQLKWLSGDKIPGEMVRTRCTRCEAQITRENIEDLWNSEKIDLKVTACVSRELDEINIKWVHLCNKCDIKFHRLFKNFMEKK